jgi:uncharacterized protein (TIGR03435 family)
VQRIGKRVLITAAFAFAVIPLLSQTTPPAQKPSFDVVSIKPSAPPQGGRGLRGGGVRGDKLLLTGANLRMLLQQGYQRPSAAGPGGQLQIIGGPGWIDSDLYDVQATANCSGGPLSREQVQLMIQSMLENRFQLKAHIEARDLPIYNMVVAKDGPKLKASADQTPTVLPAGLGPAQPCSPAGPLPPAPPPPGTPPPANFVVPRGGFRISFNGAGFTLEAASVPLGNIITTLQNIAGRPIVDKTGLKGLFDFKLQFSSEGLSGPGIPLGPPPPDPQGAVGAPAAAADPAPSLFSAIQDLGLRLESAKGPVEVLVIESVQKPTEN